MKGAMRHYYWAFVILALLLHPSGTNAQFGRFLSPFRRSRTAGPRQNEPAVASTAGSTTTSSRTSSTADGDGSSRSNSNSNGRCSSGWALSAIGGDAGTSVALPASTDHVLICLVSSGVHKDAAAIKHIRWTGCTAQDPLDPTGCTLPWSTSPSAAGFRPRGTWAAGIIAAVGSGVIPGATDIHVVPVDGPTTGAVDPSSTAPNGRSRLRAYSVCEGRLRGLQAQDYNNAGKARWRMVMLVDVAADKAAVSGKGEFSMKESDWIDTATGPGTAEAPHPPDVLIVAPAGQREAVGYPAALPKVLGVGALKCNGEQVQSYSNSGKPDILAPGANIAVATADSPWSDSAAAAAFVAGAAARLWSAYPRCSSDTIKEALLSSGAVKGQPGRLSLPAAAAYLQKNGCATQ